jgi:hypothetical protein
MRRRGTTDRRIGNAGQVGVAGLDLLPVFCALTEPAQKTLVANLAGNEQTGESLYLEVRGRFGNTVYAGYRLITHASSYGCRLATS